MPLNCVVHVFEDVPFLFPRQPSSFPLDACFSENARIKLVQFPVARPVDCDDLAALPAASIASSTGGTVAVGSVHFTDLMRSGRGAAGDGREGLKCSIGALCDIESVCARRLDMLGRNRHILLERQMA